MEQIALLLKSYQGDLEYARKLIDSFHRYNTDQLVLFCVVPLTDISNFSEFSRPNVHVLAQEDILGEYLVENPMHGLRTDYINQEIVKLAFWETGLAANYFCIDSDAVFIRPFGVRDFMHDTQTPFTVLVEDQELKVEPKYFNEHWVGRERSIRNIMSLVNLEDPIMRTCHGHQIFSSVVLKSFKEEFLSSKQWTYSDALSIEPYEFSWYCMWLQKSQCIAIHQIEPLVKVFHHEDQHLEYILRGVRTEDIARGYLAVVVNSNYSREIDISEIDASKADSLAPYLSYGEYLQVGTAKVKETFKRRFKR